jgi:ubiquinone/menaquinone biosynthesis C-methylase UbiE
MDDIQLVNDLFNKVRERQFEALAHYSLEEVSSRELAKKIKPNREHYKPLLLATASQPKRWYDWNVGFILPHLNLEWVTDILDSNKDSLAESEGIAWGLGEAGSDDDRIVDFLYFVCEGCRDFDAWWCAAEALEKLGLADGTDLKKRTLKGAEWQNITYCLQHLNERPAIIGVLRLATYENTRDLIIPNCREALKSDDRKTIQNAVWLFERLRIDDEETLKTLYDLYAVAEDKSHTLRPRIVEAFGQIASPTTRPVLEKAILEAQYYRTRAYAAFGLGKIGDQRSLEVLERAISIEQDYRVISYISEAVYSIRSHSKRDLNQLSKLSRWPENGMIFDGSNYWYANPAIYDKFSHAEDPLSLTLDFALSQIPVGAAKIIDLGTGTGRFAIHAAKSRPDIEKIIALDGNDAMHQYLVQQLNFSPDLQNRIEAVLGDLNELPFPDSSVDAAISSWAFPSKMWDPSTCLRQVKEVRRVLKDGGVLVTVGWDETFRDQLSEIWYRFVAEPDFRRESIEEWRKRRRSRIKSPRNCHLTFIKKNFKVPLLFESPKEAAAVLGHLYGFSAGEWVSHQQRCEFSILVGITKDDTEQLDLAIRELTNKIEEVT